jgi:hypothetical protein
VVEDYEARLVISHAWPEALVVKNFENHTEENQAFIELKGCRVTQGLLVSSLPLPDRLRGDESMKNATCAHLTSARQFFGDLCARFKYICWNMIVETHPAWPLITVRYTTRINAVWEACPYTCVARPHQVCVAHALFGLLGASRVPLMLWSLKAGCG